METSDIFTKIVTPIIAALGTTGVITGYWAYRSSRPKTLAEAKKTDAEVVTTFAKGWEDLYKEVYNRLEKMEDRYAKLELHLAEREKAHAEASRIKDARIAELQDNVAKLQADLLRYEIVNTQVEVVKEGLHAAVDDNLEQLKHEPK